MSTFRVVILAFLCLLVTLWCVSAENYEEQGSSGCQNCSGLKIGEMALLDMIRMSTGPVLSGASDEEMEGSWLFNYAGSGYDDYSDPGYDDYTDPGYEDPWDTGYEDPFDTGYEDPWDTGYEDPFDTGYEDPWDTGFDTFDPYNTGITTGVPSSITSPGVIIPPGSQIVAPGVNSPPASQVVSQPVSHGVSPVSSQGGYPDVITQMKNLLDQYKVKVKSPPRFKEPSGGLCIKYGGGHASCDCSKYLTRCPELVNNKETGTDTAIWKEKCCGDYTNTFGR